MLPARPELSADERPYSYVLRATELPRNWSKPVEATVEHRNERGETRSETESYAYDDYGRVVERRSADGLITTTEYDSTPTALGLPPVGLTTLQRVTAPDGLVAENRYELDPEHRARVLVEESWRGANPDSLERTRRVEYVTA